MKKLLLMVVVLFTAASAQADMARLQVIHNAADPSAAMVDIYVNGDKFIPDFAFRDATPFVDVPAGVELNIGVAPAGGSADDILATFPVTLAAGETYVAIANGVLDPTMFASNPGGASIAFNIFPRDNMREEARWRRYVDLIIFHGATDAPAVDIFAKSWWKRKIADDLSYGEFSRYRTFRATEYTIDVAPGNDPGNTLVSYTADLSGLRGGAAVVFASGFLDPSANQDGAAFGLFVALPDGTVIELPSKMAKARLQVIHNAADPGAEVVDIYVNDDLFLDDFAFRTATPFVDVPAGVELAIGVAPPNSASVDDVIATIPVTLMSGKTYVAVANGVLDPGSFAANPSGASIGFDLYARDGIRESSGYKYWVSFVAFHGATDAPEIDVVPAGLFFRWPLINDLSYGEFSQYRYLPAYKYYLDITPSGDNNTVVATYEVDLRGLGGGSAVVFASGFLDPSANQDGPAFGLFVALPDGQVIGLPAAAPAMSDLAVAEKPLPYEFELKQNYPNPFNPSTTISFSIANPGQVKLDIYNVLGQVVETLVDRQMEAGTYQMEWDGSKVASGIYFYKLQSESQIQTRKMVLLK